jgi:hypothetical protein
LERMAAGAADAASSSLVERVDGSRVREYEKLLERWEAIRSEVVALAERVRRWRGDRLQFRLQTASSAAVADNEKAR